MKQTCWRNIQRVVSIKIVFTFGALFFMSVNTICAVLPQDRAQPLSAVPAPQASAAPSSAVEIPRAAVLEDIETCMRDAGATGVTEAHKTTMVDIMVKVHKAAQALTIQLMKDTDRWGLSDASAQSEMYQEAARMRLEEHLKKSMSAAEAASKSHNLQALYVEKMAANKERVEALIVELPSTMKLLFKKWWEEPSYFQFTNLGSCLGAFETGYLTVYFDCYEEESAADKKKIESLLHVLEESYVHWKEDEAKLLRVFEKNLSRARRAEQSRERLNGQVMGVLENLRAQNVLSAEQFATFSKPETLEAMTSVIPSLFSEVTKSWLLEDYGMPLEDVRDSYVLFQDAPSYAHLFKDIYVLLLQLLQTDEEALPAESADRDLTLFRYFFSYKQ